MDTPIVTTAPETQSGSGVMACTNTSGVVVAGGVVVEEDLADEFASAAHTGWSKIDLRWSWTVYGEGCARPAGATSIIGCSPDR